MLNHISVTLEPEQVIPFQDSLQGSPPLDFQLVSCCAEFKLVYKRLRLDTARTSINDHIKNVKLMGQEAIKVQSN